MWWATTYTWSPCSAGAPSEMAGRSTTPPARGVGSRMARWPRCGSSSGTCSRSTSSGREIGSYEPPLDGVDGQGRNFDSAAGHRAADPPRLLVGLDEPDAALDIGKAAEREVPLLRIRACRDRFVAVKSLRAPSSGNPS